jgi:hypothetical protein
MCLGGRRWEMGRWGDRREFGDSDGDGDEVTKSVSESLRGCGTSVNDITYKLTTLNLTTLD